MSTDSKIPSSRGFPPEEAPTAKHRTTVDALANFYEIQAEVEKARKIEENHFDSNLRMLIVKSLEVIKEKIKHFEEYLGIY